MTDDAPMPSPGISCEMLVQLHELHVINLDRSPLRWETFRQKNNHLGNYIRVPAVDGANINRQDYIDNGEITEDLPYGPGTLGCALSHIGLWKQAAAQDRIMTVLEDDVIVSQDFEAQTARIMTSLPPDWDMIQWGYVFDPCFMWLDFGVAKAELRFYDNRISNRQESFQTLNLMSSAVRLANSFGLQAYSLSPKGARTLLEFCRPLRKQLVSFPGAGVVIEDQGLDCAMNGLYDKILAFVCLPPLVIQMPDQESDRRATGG